MRKIISLAAGLGAAVATIPAAAITTFATFTPTSNVANINFVGAGNAGAIASTPASPVTFRFLDATGTTSVFDVSAIFNFAAGITGGTIVSGIAIAPATAGTTSFTSVAPVTFNGHTGTNLLTAAFTGGAFTGLVGGSAASYVNSQPPSAVTFTSDFLDFSQTTARDISIAINAINPSIGGGPGGLGDFSGSASGLFGADLSSGAGNDIVPEPAAWVMMVAGFGLVGVMTRRRSQMRIVEA